MKIKIFNQTSKKEIKHTFKLANTFKKRLIGLSFKKNINYGLIIKVKGNFKINSSIHSYFMKFPIEIYFLDNDLKIFEKTILRPWSWHKPSKKAKYIIEIKENTIKKEYLKKRDKLKLIYIV